MKLKNPAVYPLLWVQIKQKYVNTTINYHIRQKVAAKFVSLKLLKSSGSGATCNIDLYNLGMKAIPLNLSSSDFD